MHMLGEPGTMQQAPHYGDVVGEVEDFLAERLDAAMAAGIARERIVVDPGIGFGKTLRHNLQLLAALDHDRPMETGEHHPEDQAMLEGLLEVLPPGGPARVAATARLAVVAHHGPAWQDHLHRADEALRLARETGDAFALARAVAAKRFDAQRPGFSLAERRALTAELEHATADRLESLAQRSFGGAGDLR